MKKVLLLLLFLCFTATSFAMDFGDQKVNDLYSAIIKEGFHDKKIGIGAELGLLKTAGAKKALMTLIADEHYWNREAGVTGLFYFKDKDVCDIMVNKYLDDHMIESELQDGFLKNWDIYFPALKKAYHSQTEKKPRIKLVGLINSRKDEHSENFLKSVVSDTLLEEKIEAFKLLTLSYEKGNNKYFRSFLEDMNLRGYVLDYILAHGDKKDLPVFTSILENQEKKYTGKALMAVDKWETPEKKEKIFYTYLSSDNTDLFYPALYSPANVKSERIMKELCRISEKSEEQQVRMMAALKLIDYNDKKIIPYLKRFHKEAFIPAKADGGKVFMAHITFGMTVAFDYFSEKQREKKFKEVKEKVAEKLIEMLSE